MLINKVKINKDNEKLGFINKNKIYIIDNRTMQERRFFFFKLFF